MDVKICMRNVFQTSLGQIIFLSPILNGGRILNNECYGNVKKIRSTNITFYNQYVFVYWMGWILACNKIYSTVFSVNIYANLTSTTYKFWFMVPIK